MIVEARITRILVVILLEFKALVFLGSQGKNKEKYLIRPFISFPEIFHIIRFSFHVWQLSKP